VGTEACKSGLAQGCDRPQRLHGAGDPSLPGQDGTRHRPPDLVPPAGSGFLVYGAGRTCKVSNSHQPRRKSAPLSLPKQRRLLEPHRVPPLPPPPHTHTQSQPELSQTAPVPPEGLNGLPVCQSKQGPWAGHLGTAWCRAGRRLHGKQGRTGDLFSLEIPLGKACQPPCQVQSAPILRIH
jgi:hypothetical protein